MHATRNLPIFALNYGQSTTAPRPQTGRLLSMYHTQVSLKRRLIALYIAAHADGCPAPAYPLPLPHLHRRGENDSNALGYGEIAVAVIGVVVAALGVFKG